MSHLAHEHPRKKRDYKFVMRQEFIVANYNLVQFWRSTKHLAQCDELHRSDESKTYHKIAYHG